MSGSTQAYVIYSTTNCIIIRREIFDGTLERFTRRFRRDHGFDDQLATSTVGARKSHPTMINRCMTAFVFEMESSGHLSVMSSAVLAISSTAPCDGV
jgi:hypothetical protein